MRRWLPCPTTDLEHRAERFWEHENCEYLLVLVHNVFHGHVNLRVDAEASDQQMNECFYYN